MFPINIAVQDVVATNSTDSDNSTSNSTETDPSASGDDQVDIDINLVENFFIVEEAKELTA